VNKSSNVNFVSYLIYIIIESFDCDFGEIIDFTQQLEDNVYKFATEYIKRLFKNINTNLLRKFNGLFKKDESGKNRDWKALEEGAIRDLHQKCKVVIGDIIK
jgi:hypothetical protein